MLRLRTAGLVRGNPLRPGGRGTPPHRQSGILERRRLLDRAAQGHRPLTRSSLVRKAMFMPGFAPGTGGLIIDRRFRSLRGSLRRPRSPPRPAPAPLLRRLPEGVEDGRRGFENRFWVSVFSYERDYSAIVRGPSGLPQGSPGPRARGRLGKAPRPFWMHGIAGDDPFPFYNCPFFPRKPGTR